MLSSNLEMFLRWRKAWILSAIAFGGLLVSGSMLYGAPQCYEGCDELTHYHWHLADLKVPYRNEYPRAIKPFYTRGAGYGNLDNLMDMHRWNRAGDQEVCCNGVKYCENDSQGWDVGGPHDTYTYTYCNPCAT